LGNLELGGCWILEDGRQRTEDGEQVIRLSENQGAGYQVKEQKAEDRGAKGQSELANWFTPLDNFLISHGVNWLIG